MLLQTIGTSWVRRCLTALLLFCCLAREKSYAEDTNSCGRHSFDKWWELLSPCFDDELQNNQSSTGGNLPNCLTAPHGEDQHRILEAVERFNSTVVGNETLAAMAQQMVEDVPSDYIGFCPGDFNSMIKFLRVSLQTPPIYLHDAPNFIGVPITSTVVCYMHSPAGKYFFEDPTINQHMRRIVLAWTAFLDSPESLSVFNNGTFGWMSDCAQDALDIESNYLPNATATAWGFTSFNDFFTRPFKPGTRPIDDSPDIGTAFGDVGALHIEHNVSYQTDMYMKNEAYSLYNIFNGDEKLSREFESGTAINVYFSPGKYHGYHAPVAGVITKAFRVPGLIFAQSESTLFPVLPGNGTLEDYIDYGQDNLLMEEIYIPHVANRCVFILDAEESGLGLVALVFVGMTEVSGCTIDEKFRTTPNQQVIKGEKLGTFQYGGSAGVMILQPEAITESVLSWLVSVGDELIVGQPLFEFQSSQMDLRADQETSSSKSGATTACHTLVRVLSAGVGLLLFAVYR